MTEKLNPYDTNLLAEIEARIKAKRNREKLDKKLAEVFEGDFNPYDLNQVAIFNRLHSQYSGTQVDHSKGLFKID